jgi:hypothetical protein
LSDKDFPTGDGVTKMKFKDLGGQHARVIAVASSGASAAGDRTMALGDGVTKIRLRDMGDGTHAELKYGV